MCKNDDVTRSLAFVKHCDIDEGGIKYSQDGGGGGGRGSNTHTLLPVFPLQLLQM